VINLLLGVLASALVVAALYFGYWFSYKHYSEQRAYAECWWLSRWNCYRLVIRNMHDKGNLTAVQYRSWIRRIVPAEPGSSVNTLVDNELSCGERIILPSGQDLPVLCFRFEQRHGTLVFVQTDKQGSSIQEFELEDDVEAIIAEYTVKIHSWFLFKHEIVRMFDIPHTLDIDGEQTDLFKDFLLLRQQEEEFRVKTVFQTAQEVAVSI
jgi:hypothetical protein